MKKVAYIAGPIASDPGYQARFKRAELILDALGYIVLNPAGLPGGLRRRDYMRMCFPMIDTADLVVFLPGWTESPGAKLERAYCEYIDRPVFSIADCPAALAGDALASAILEAGLFQSAVKAEG